MSGFCKFCTLNNGSHTDNCSRNQPNAGARYKLGYREGRVRRERSGNDAAYEAGWAAGELAAYVHGRPS